MATGTYELDRAHSTVQFAVKHVGVSTFRASFADVDARLTVEDGAIALEGRVGVESVSIVEPAEFREHVVRGRRAAGDCHRARVPVERVERCVRIPGVIRDAGY